MAIKENVNWVFQHENTHEQYLLGMSGGIDSTVLFHLMLDLGLTFEVAHANFGLRGNESIEDEVFLKQICHEHSIPFHSKRFDTKKYIETHNESIQSAARKLRYTWFFELLKNNSLDKVITAHTLNDSAETFFINLIRGTGIQGLTGIQSTDKVLRPLLSTTKKEIRAYAVENQIIWREDSSNATDDYVRNKIRHHVIPSLEKIESNFLHQFEALTNYICNDIDIIEDYVENIRTNLFIEEKDSFKIPIMQLSKIENTNVIFYLFEPYGFNHPQEVLKMIHAKESAEIQSDNYRLIKNRDELLLTPKDNLPPKKYILNDLEEIKHPVHLRFELLNKTPTSKINILDLEKINFPLSLRIRQAGDVFYPLGMKGKSKTLSKFYKDIKLSKLEKERTWLLCDADDNIIWVVGHRFDERFRATNTTKKWLQIEKLD